MLQYSFIPLYNLPKKEDTLVTHNVGHMQIIHDRKDAYPEEEAN